MARAIALHGSWLTTSTVMGSCQRRNTGGYCCLLGRKWTSSTPSTWSTPSPRRSAAPTVWSPCWPSARCTSGCRTWTACCARRGRRRRPRRRAWWPRPGWPSGRPSRCRTCRAVSTPSAEASAARRLYCRSATPTWSQSARARMACWSWRQTRWLRRARAGRSRSNASARPPTRCSSGAACVSSPFSATSDTTRTRTCSA
mmetsp:Transcript_26673/g.86174  ORF Transcript_26673/g.86174 Transcript_26673/m.86174 type:complete len:200 (-) Transcript_26673:622-1221(-)